MSSSKVTKLNARSSRKSEDSVTEAVETETVAEATALDDKATAQVAAEINEEPKIERRAYQQKLKSQKALGANDAELQQMVNRIIKLTHQAENPGMAYRNLETIRALAESLAKKLEITLEQNAHPKH